MDLRAHILPTTHPLRSSLGLLALRLVVGAGLMHHGWGKIQNPFHWMGDGAEAPAGVLQAIAAVSEFVGGLGLLTGLLTPLAALGVFSTMGYAIYTHVSKGQPFFDMKGPSYELAALYAAAAVALGLIGPGLFSLDSLVWRKRR